MFHGRETFKFGEDFLLSTDFTPERCGKVLLLVKENKYMSLSLAKNECFVSEIGSVGYKVVKHPDESADDSEQFILMNTRLHDDFSDAFLIRDKLEMLTNLTKVLLKMADSQTDESKMSPFLPRI